MGGFFMGKLNEIALTKKLIDIPSYVDSICDEKNIGDFLYEYLQKNTSFKIKKQKVIGKRYNLILTDNSPTELLITGHLDTVQPKNKNELSSKIIDNKLCGLGSSDMKGSIAALISALEECKKTKGVMVLLYVDEEYDFLGMKKFIEEYESKIKPKFIVSGDGYDLKIGNGCRGLIEITFTISGKTGHASNPKNGINAIEKGVKTVSLLSKKLSKEYSSKNLGRTTCNLAFLQGGLNLGKKNNALRIGKEGNNIADIAEFVLDIRPTDPQLSATKIITIFTQLLKKEELVLEDSTIRHDYGAWITPQSQLISIKKILGAKSYSDIARFGYIDIQMLWEKFNKVPCFTFGAGKQSLMHKAGEYVEIDSLKKVKKSYIQLLKTFGGGIV